VDFAPLVAAWREFLKNIVPPDSSSDSFSPPEAPSAVEELEDRPDWDSFVRRLLGLPDAEESPEKVEVSSPLVTSLDALADLMRIEHPGRSDSDQGQKARKKPGASDRKKIADAARVEGFLILPDLGIAGKEYQWDDPVALAPFPAGVRPSQDYSAAALLLEYAWALARLSGEEEIEKLKTLATRLDDYFSLTSDDHARLDTLSSIFSMAPSNRNPDNIGECLQFWLQREQRIPIRDFLISFLAPLTPADAGGGNEELISAVSDSLDMERLLSTGAAPISPEARLELGPQVGKILAPLFKD
jgi:hypothetical protein